MATLDPARTLARAEELWRTVNLPLLEEIGRIKALSPGFDPNWAETGEIDRMARTLKDWAIRQEKYVVALAAVINDELKDDSGKRRTPLLYAEFPSTLPKELAHCPAAMVYAHMDKQPPTGTWTKAPNAWTPTISEDGMYLVARGVADNGYPLPMIVTAVRLLDEQGVAHPRINVLIEASEESGSPDLEAHLTSLAPIMGPVGAVFVLDSGCLTTDRLWLTTSLRGAVIGTLTVSLLTEGRHSGSFGGLIPDIETIERILLNRVHDALLDRIILEKLFVDIPADRMAEIAEAGRLIGPDLFTALPLLPGVRLDDRLSPTQYLQRTWWEPTMCRTGQEGLPSLSQASGTLHPRHATRRNFRIPPTLDAELAYLAFKQVFEKDPPYRAHISFEGMGVNGWNADPVAPWLMGSLDQVSRAYFGNPAAKMGEGGHIGLPDMIEKFYPGAIPIITGLLDPQSGAHTGDEQLNIPAAIRLTCCIAQTIADCAAHLAQKNREFDEIADMSICRDSR